MIPAFHTPSQAAPLIYFRGSHEIARLSTAFLSRCFELATDVVGWNSKQLDQSKAETAVLKDVTLSTTPLRCYVMIEHEGDEYLGALLFEDHNRSEERRVGKE